MKCDTPDFCEVLNVFKIFFCELLCSCLELCALGHIALLQVYLITFSDSSSLYVTEVCISFILN